MWQFFQSSPEGIWGHSYSDPISVFVDCVCLGEATDLFEQVMCFGSSCDKGREKRWNVLATRIGVSRLDWLDFCSLSDSMVDLKGKAIKYGLPLSRLVVPDLGGVLQVWVYSSGVDGSIGLLSFRQSNGVWNLLDTWPDARDYPYLQRYVLDYHRGQIRGGYPTKKAILRSRPLVGRKIRYPLNVEKSSWLV